MNLISACANHMNPALSYVAPSSVLSAQLLAGITPVSLGDDSWFANVSTQSQFDWGNLETRAYHEDARHKMNFLKDKGGESGRTMPMDAHGINQGLMAKANIDITDKHVLTVGSEYQRYRLNDWWDPIGTNPTKMMQGPFRNINEGKHDRLDVFTEWECAGRAPGAENCGFCAAVTTGSICASMRA